MDDGGRANDQMGDGILVGCRFDPSCPDDPDVAEAVRLYLSLTLLHRFLMIILGRITRLYHMDHCI